MSYAGALLGGPEIIENPDLVVKIRVRRHRKKRIDKKWEKRYGYRIVPDRKGYLFKDEHGRVKIIIHPYYAHHLQMELAFKEMMK